MTRIAIPGSQWDVPGEVQERLKRIDPALHLRRMRMAYVDQGANGAQSGMNGPGDTHFTEVWHVCMTWPENDARRSRVQSGEISDDNAFDLLGTIPADCDLHAIGGYVEASIRRASTPRHVLDGVAAWNEDQSLRNVSGALEAGEETIDRIVSARRRGRSRTD